MDLSVSSSLFTDCVCGLPFTLRKGDQYDATELNRTVTALKSLSLAWAAGAKAVIIEAKAKSASDDLKMRILVISPSASATHGIDPRRIFDLEPFPSHDYLRTSYNALIAI